MAIKIGPGPSKVTARGTGSRVTAKSADDRVSTRSAKANVSARSKGSRVSAYSAITVSAQDVADDTASQADVLSGKTFHSRGASITGTMPDNGAVSATITSPDGVYTVPSGKHSGSGTVRIDQTEAAKLIPANIKLGVTILGVAGDCHGGYSAQSKTVTPTTSVQVIVPDSGYDCLSSVTVAAAQAMTDYQIKSAVDDGWEGE